jgi:hypothetical protein
VAGAGRRHHSRDAERLSHLRLADVRRADRPALSPSNGGQNGQPDTNSTIGAVASNGAYVPAVWATFRDLDTIMLNNGADPGASYTQSVTIPSNCAPIGATRSRRLHADVRECVDVPERDDREGLHQSGNEQSARRSEGLVQFTNIRINESEYNYIRQKAITSGRTR